jgi:hypothetical protein
MLTEAKNHISERNSKAVFVLVRKDAEALEAEKALTG